MKKLIGILLVLTLALSLAPMALATGSTQPLTLDNFADKGEIEDSTAVEALLALNIIEGVPTEIEGVYKLLPSQNLTREQGCKLVVYAVLGKTAADKLPFPPVNSFTDVDKGRWSAPFIAYCVQNGIVEGVGDGSFAPGAPLTGTAFAKMMLCALGYGKLKEYSGAGWDMNVAMDANKVGLYKDLDADVDRADPINRETAFHVAFNTLSVNKVTLDKENEVYVSTVKPLVDLSIVELPPKVCYVNAVWEEDGQTKFRASFIDGVSEVYATAAPKEGVSLTGLQNFVKSADGKITLKPYTEPEFGADGYHAATSGTVGVSKEAKLSGGSPALDTLTLADDAKFFVHTGAGIAAYTGATGLPAGGLSHAASVFAGVFYRVREGKIDAMVFVNYAPPGGYGPTATIMYGIYVGLDDVVYFYETDVNGARLDGNERRSQLPISAGARELFPSDVSQYSIFKFTVTNGVITAAVIVAELDAPE